MTAIKERDPNRPIKHGGRPPRVTDDLILDALIGWPAGTTVQELAIMFGMHRSTMAYRLGCLELEGRVTRRRTGPQTGDQWEAA